MYVLGTTKRNYIDPVLLQRFCAHIPANEAQKYNLRRQLQVFNTISFFFALQPIKQTMVLKGRQIARILISMIAGSFLIPGQSCSKNSGSNPTEDPEPSEPKAELYFPGTGSPDWDAVSMADLEWKAGAKQPLYDLLAETNTKAFIIVKDGKIAMEEYFGTFTKDSIWYWASAGKTLTSFMVGIAQEKGILNIDDRTSRYLGEGWTTAPPEKEALITIRNQLTMTSGLDDSAFDCITPDCLTYMADAGSRWAYHNGTYTLLQNVVSEAINTPFPAFFNTYLRNKIGMGGAWVSTNGSNSVYFSDARSMARFGLLNLNRGVWDGETILADTEFLNAMTETSQEYNKSYGYLWWLNGKDSYMAPSVQFTFQGNLIPNAPSDTFSGLGKNDQKLYVVPSRSLVVVRLGDETGNNDLGPTGFDSELWEKISDLIQ